MPPDNSSPSTGALPRGHIEIDVTDDHIDSLGHVNNAVYVKYFERARIAFYAQLELPLETRQAPRLGTVVVNLNVNFRAECVSGERLELTTLGERRGNRSFTLYQTLSRPDGSPVADCTVTSVVMNLDTRAVEPIPPALAAALPG